MNTSTNINLHDVKRNYNSARYIKNQAKIYNIDPLYVSKKYIKWAYELELYLSILMFVYKSS
jgi:hypothetical protein